MSKSQDSIVREMATDISYPEYENIPGWLYDLLENLVAMGWRKNESTDK